MSVQTYLEGSRLELVATFEDSAGVLTNPTGVTYSIRNPDGTVDTAVWPAGTVVNSSPGVFVLQYDVDDPGTYKVHVQGTGTIKAPVEDMVDVMPSHVV